MAKQKTAPVEEKKEPVLVFFRSAEVREATLTEDGKGNVLEAVINTDDIDRYGTIVDPQGADFTNYLKNPVLMWSHGMDGMMGTWPVGRVLSLDRTKREIVARVEFDTKSALGAELDRLYREKWLRGFSIRFNPIDAVYEMIDERQIIRYTKWELIEVSAVTVPANQNALSRAMTDGTVKIVDPQLLEQVTRQLDPPAEPPIETPAPQPEQAPPVETPPAQPETPPAPPVETPPDNRMLDAMQDLLRSQAELIDTLNARSGATFSKKNRAAIEAAAENLERAAEGLRDHAKTVAAAAAGMRSLIATPESEADNAKSAPAGVSGRELAPNVSGQRETVAEPPKARVLTTEEIRAAAKPLLTDLVRQSVAKVLADAKAGRLA